jgi:ABC-type glycerol-3-phosphate transport system substrate-binding protein
VPRITRRRLLQASAAMLASGGAPALAQPTTLRWLRPSDPIPASDQLLREKIVPECQKALGIRLDLEIVRRTELDIRLAAALAALSGPEIVLGAGEVPRLHQDDLADVGDLAREIAKVQGGFYAVSSAVADADGTWIAVPWSIAPSLVAYRKSWFDEIGYDRFPDSWEELHNAGLRLKTKGRPFGQSLGRAAAEAPRFWYPLLWSWGGKEVEEDGKTVVLDDKATVASLAFAAAFWHDACDENGLEWDDAAGRDAFLSGKTCAVTAAASLYLAAKADPGKYKSETGKPLFQDIAYAALPKGAGGQFNFPAVFANMLMDYAPDQKPARDFLRWVSSKPVFEQWFTSQQGYSNGATLAFALDPLWQSDPVLLPFRDAPKAARLAGYAGPPDAAAAAARRRGVILDMYAKAVQGMPPAAAAQSAQQQLTRIYD